MNNILKAVCDFLLNNIPFLQRAKNPFENDNFLKNIALLSSAFFSRQLVVVTGVPGSGKSSLLFYAVNELDPSSFRVCHVELSNPNKKALYKALTKLRNGPVILLVLLNFILSCSFICRSAI